MDDAQYVAITGMLLPRSVGSRILPSIARGLRHRPVIAWVRAARFCLGPFRAGDRKVGHLTGPWKQRALQGRHGIVLACKPAEKSPGAIVGEEKRRDRDRDHDRQCNCIRTDDFARAKPVYELPTCSARDR